MTDRPKGYGTTARILHWLVAALILMMFPVGLLMVRDGLDRGVQDALFLFHKTVGTLVLGVVTVRMAWRATHRPDPMPAILSAWQRRAAGLSHAALYGLMLVMPLSGYVRVRAGGFPIEALDRIGLPTLIPRSAALADAASAVHQVTGWLLLAVLALHIAAALHHALIRRDGIWGRIWPPVTRL